MSKKIKESVRVSRGIAGIYLRPVDSGHCDLLLKLFNGEAIEMGNPVSGTLEEVLQEVREVAAGFGITMSICGNRKRNPTIHLWGAIEPSTETPKNVFEHLSRDAAHSTITDFSGEHEIALREAIVEGGAFTTGWFSVKKEIMAGKVSRDVRHGPIEVEVSVEMDEPHDLADSAFWKASGGNDAGSCGSDVLSKLGLSQEQQYQQIERVARSLAGDTTSTSGATLHWRSGYKKVCAELEKSADFCSKELDSIFEGAVELCEDLLEDIKAASGQGSSSASEQSGD